MKPRWIAGPCALVAVLALAGCSDLGEPIRLLPHAVVSTTSLDFGTVGVGLQATRDVTVHNSGNAPLHGAASVGCAGFAVVTGGGAFTVPPGGEHEVTVAYTPSDVGSSNCVLQLGSDIPPVDLNGAGALQPPGAQCVLSTSSLSFVTIAVGASAQDGYTISNPGTAPLILDVVATCPDFVVISGGGASTLPPGGSLTVTVQFVPQRGGSIACAIANGPQCPNIAVSGFATSVSFASDLRPILNNPCGFCHVWPNPSSLVNVPSSFYPGHVLVTPLDPDNSLLYIKIAGQPPPGLGTRMPQSFPPLSAAQIDKFRRWIEEGALDN